MNIYEEGVKIFKNKPVELIDERSAKERSMEE